MLWWRIKINYTKHPLRITLTNTKTTLSHLRWNPSNKTLAFLVVAWIQKTTWWYRTSVKSSTSDGYFRHQNMERNTKTQEYEYEMLREKLTFPSFWEDSGFSDFFRPINALIHFPDTPIASASLSQSSTNLEHKYMAKSMQK